ncbi:hypothetical protein A8950_0367 [Dongia mobilis]|uniref:Glycosyltransferase involved in cell wall biosynthesis n=1 Tax=Dongia mobilis TaxID=578943 RepID=A0A4R6WUY7_9PROT|nr:hypothetical protein [Dongia mobilis]TDQ83824.1 hypothetical protein A8950_0367 [Dongia mobilis]
MMEAARRAWMRWVERPETAGAKLARRIDWESATPGRITVLCLERSQFIKDIEELRRLTDMNWVTLSSTRVKLRQELWVPEADREQGYFSVWLKEKRCAHLRPILERFGIGLLREAQKVMPVDAVAAANIDYWQDEALKLGCRRLGIPFLVLCRENYTIPWTVPWMHDHLAKSGFRFEGQGLAVFSQATKDAFAPGFDNADDIWITGAPRYDRWMHLEPLPESAKNAISLITFSDPGYMATNTFLDVAAIFDKVARAEHRDGLTWLVKCKKRGDRKRTLQKIGALEGSPLDFQYDTPLFELYPRSRIVIGYNSLALVEAMLTDAPVVVPCWGETRPPRRDVLLDYNDPLTRRVVTFADSPEAFADLLTRAARGEKLPTGSSEDRRALFEQHIHVPGRDGGPATASAATEAFVRHYVARARQQGMPRQAA